MSIPIRLTNEANRRGIRIIMDFGYDVSDYENIDRSKSWSVSYIRRAPRWTDGAKATLKPSTILIAAAEDDPARTVVPRLIAASADLSRIKFLRPVKATELVKSGRDEVMSTSLRELQLQADLDALRETLKANHDIALVILDPAWRTQPTTTC